jgi:hypothetical protein
LNARAEFPDGADQLAHALDPDLVRELIPDTDERRQRVEEVPEVGVDSGLLEPHGKQVRKHDRGGFVPPVDLVTMRGAGTNPPLFLMVLCHWASKLTSPARGVKLGSRYQWAVRWYPAISMLGLRLLSVGTMLGAFSRAFMSSATCGNLENCWQTAESSVPSRRTSGSPPERTPT